MIDILIVEDSREIATLIKDFLEKENYIVSVAENGEKALQLYEKYGARLILLDVMLPGIDGFNVCSKIRESSNTPIIILSAKTGKEDKLNGIILGADDYMEKPIDIDILVAKIKGIFKRRYDIEIINEANFTLNTVQQILTVNKKQYELTSKECELLKILIQNKNTTLKKANTEQETKSL